MIILISSMPMIILLFVLWRKNSKLKIFQTWCLKADARTTVDEIRAFNDHMMAKHFP